MGDLSEHFNRSEFRCRCGCGFDTVDHELIGVLEDVRRHFGAFVQINSGARCPTHNASIGGAAGSMHRHAKAADIVVDGVPPDRVYRYLAGKHPGKYGIKRYASWVHVDVRPLEWRAK